MIDLRFVATMMSIAAMPALAQPGPLKEPPPYQPPQYIPLPPGGEAQRQRYLDYQKCVAENGERYRLYSAARQVINVRDNRVAAEYELANDAERRKQFPGGYSQILETSFAMYRDAGGKAASPAEVTPVPTPCPTPGLAPPPRR